MSSNTQGEPSSWTGWIVFAAVIMFIIGCINVIQGLAALLKHTVYVLPSSGLLVSTDYTGWGWILVLWGIIMATAAHGLLSGSQLARWFAVIVVGINLLGQFVFFPAYPLWSLLVIGLDVAVLFALTARWGEAQSSLRG